MEMRKFLARRFRQYDHGRCGGYEQRSKRLGKTLDIAGSAHPRVPDLCCSKS